VAASCRSMCNQINADCTCQPMGVMETGPATVAHAGEVEAISGFVRDGGPGVGGDGSERKPDVGIDDGDAG
jgi:hypothetical protein